MNWWVYCAVLVLVVIALVGAAAPWLEGAFSGLADWLAGGG